MSPSAVDLVVNVHTVALPLDLKAYEAACIARALGEAGGHGIRAADLLGVPKSTFYRRWRKSAQAFPSYFDGTVSVGDLFVDAPGPKP